jgi:hypothetical protein
MEMSLWDWSKNWVHWPSDKPDDTAVREPETLTRPTQPHRHNPVSWDQCYCWLLTARHWTLYELGETSPHAQTLSPTIRPYRLCLGLPRVCFPSRILTTVWYPDLFHVFFNLSKGRYTRHLPNKIVYVLIFLLWIATPREFIGRYQRFGGTYCLHLQGWISCKLASCGGKSSGNRQ